VRAGGAGLSLKPVQAPLSELLRAALQRRRPLLAALDAEQTDCYRLLHGAVEGCPGLSIDRYGSLLLLQTWGLALEPGQIKVARESVEAALTVPLQAVWNCRTGKGQDFSRYFEFDSEGPFSGCELGLYYDVRPRHRGIDPLLFCDLRVGRRMVLERAESKRVLNLFSYTCGLGIAAASGGCSQVTNVDFSSSSLAIGRGNAERNDISSETFATLHADVLPTLRQFAGLPVKGRASRRRDFVRVEPQQFDLVLLDPPAWSRGPFGAVDVVRDYQALFKPALLATRPGGSLLVTNNSARVACDDWIDVLQRCANKAGRPIRDLQLLPPEADFPSSDGRHPLKIALVEV